MSLNVHLTHPDKDHIYLNATLYNDTQTTANPVWIRATLGQVRDQPFLQDPDMWNVSIVRLSVNSSFIPRCSQAVVATPTSTRLWVSLSWNGVYYDTQLNIPVGFNPIGETRRNVYDVSSFLSVVNAALLASQLLAVAAGMPAPYGVAFFSFDAATQLFSLNIPDWYGASLSGLTFGAPGAGTGIHLSTDLQAKLGSFPTVAEYPLTNNNHQYTIIRLYTGDNYIAASTFYFGGVPIGAGAYFVLRQDSRWASRIEDVQRLVVTTTTLPAVLEYKQTAFSTQGGGSGNNQLQGVLTDFYCGTDSPLLNRGEYLKYQPQFLRITSLKGSSPLNQWDLSLFVSDPFETHALYIEPGASIDVKILFLKKGLTN